ELTDAVTEQRATYQQLLALLVVEQSDLPVGHGAGVLRVRDLRRGALGAAGRVHSRGDTGESALPLGQRALREEWHSDEQDDQADQDSEATPMRAAQHEDEHQADQDGRDRLA